VRLTGRQWFMAGSPGGQAVITPGGEVADSNAVPTYDVKINLTTTALDASHVPTSAVKTAFGITGSAAARSYACYDTDALDLDDQGWSVRLRHRSGSSYEETYRMRFPVTGGDAVAVADAHGCAARFGHLSRTEWRMAAATQPPGVPS
jgi:hypothetical protein